MMTFSSELPDAARAEVDLDAIPNHRRRQIEKACVRGLEALNFRTRQALIDAGFTDRALDGSVVLKAGLLSAYYRWRQSNGITWKPVKA
jgi:hypothetical protein